MNFIRQWLRSYIGIPDQPQPGQTSVDYEHQRVMDMIMSLHAETSMLSQKFDLLSDAIGVVIVADCVRNPPQAFIESARDDKEYIRSVLVADKIVAAHRHMIDNVNALMDSIDWRRRQTEKRRQAAANRKREG
jgi:hypothetical protein